MEVPFGHQTFSDLLQWYEFLFDMWLEFSSLLVQQSYVAPRDRVVARLGGRLDPLLEHPNTHVNVEIVMLDQSFLELSVPLANIFNVFHLVEKYSMCSSAQTTIRNTSASSLDIPSFHAWSKKPYRYDEPEPAKESLSNLIICINKATSNQAKRRKCLMIHQREHYIVLEIFL